MIVYVSLLISIVGLLMFALSNNGKVSAVGLHMFWVGLLAALLQMPPHLLSVLPK